MNPFIHLPQYSVIVCRKCKYAVLPSQIDAHLKNKKKHRYNKEERQTIIQEIAKLPGLIQSEAQLEAFQFPPKTVISIPKLKAPRPNGLKCRLCEYVICHPQLIQEHCRAVHRWENEWKKGRPSYKKRQVEPEWPWISGVHCQQFFKQGPKSGFFEVMGEEVVQEREAEPDMWAKVQKITAERLEHIEKKEKEKVEEADENAEPNPWLKRVGWVRHLKDKNPERLRAAIEPPNPNEEPELQAIIESFGWVVSTAQCIAVLETVGINALFEVNRKVMTQKPAMPFSSAIGEDTLKKYRGFWEQLLCYMYRMQEDEQFEADRPGYQLTRAQQNAFNALVVAVDEMTDQVEDHSMNR
jgi:hypothetical protein